MLGGAGLAVLAAGLIGVTSSLPCVRKYENTKYDGRVTVGDAPTIATVRERSSKARRSEGVSRITLAPRRPAPPRRG